MPAVKTEAPRALQPYLFHGLQLDWHGSSSQAQGSCPFCDKEKFFVSVETGQWDCKVCGVKGNAMTFLRQLWTECDKRTNGQTSELASRRGLAHGTTLMEWGVVKSVVSGDWLVPGYGADGKLVQLYRYVRDAKTKKMVLLATTGMSHGLHGVNLLDPGKPDVYVCEGPWDAMALWEVMRSTKVTDDGLAFTGNVDASLLGGANVLAVPGCNVFNEQWCSLLAGKRVFLLFDSDHPVGQNGSTREPVGYAGMRRLTATMSKSGDGQPREVQYLHWGDAGYDPQRKSGYDVRDLLGEGGPTAQGRVPRLAELLGMLRPVPKDWVPGGGSTKPGSVEVEGLPCDSWRTLETAFKKAMRLSDGLNRALSVMLSSVVSVHTPGDQLWVKVIGPAACGKSSLCEAVSANKRHVLAKSTIRGFHSGFKSDAAGQEDNSLMHQVRGKTLVTKDGDTLLQSPNKDQILSEARDVYDGTSRTHYRNKMGKDYENFRVTWILCGTAALRAIDSSELGERFLDCVIMDRIDEDEEDEILDRVISRTVHNMQAAGQDGSTSTNDADMTRAMRLTSGYIDHLKARADDLLAALDVGDRAREECKRLARFVAYMRARPSGRQIETAEREFSSRLAIQLMRLAMCLAVVLGRRGLDGEVMRRVRQVALDTARGRVFEVARHLHAAGDRGMEVGQLYLLTGQKLEDEKVLLQFLGKLGAVEVFTKKVGAVQSRPRWRLTPSIRRLYSSVMASRK